MKRFLLLIVLLSVLLKILAINLEYVKEDKEMGGITGSTNTLRKRQTGFVGSFPALGGEDKAGKVFTTTANVFTQSDNLIISRKRPSLKFDQEVGGERLKVESNVVIDDKTKQVVSPTTKKLNDINELVQNEKDELNIMNVDGEQQRASSSSSDTSIAQTTNEELKDENLSGTSLSSITDLTPQDKEKDAQLLTLTEENSSSKSNEAQNEESTNQEIENSKHLVKRRLFRGNLYELEMIQKREENNLEEVLKTDLIIEPLGMGWQENIGHVHYLDDITSAQVVELSILNRIVNMSPDMVQLISQRESLIRQTN